MRAILSLALFLLVQALMAGTAKAADPADAKIEALIAHVAGMSTAKFLRNGTEYDAANAAKFLRAKWDRQRAEIHSADDFITKIATKSSTSGKAYRIRFADGSETDCGPYLRGRLKKLDDSSKDKASEKEKKK